MDNESREVSDEEVDATLDYLLSVGAYEDVGVDPVTGDRLLRMTEVMKEVWPEYYEHEKAEFSREVDVALAGLYEKGLIDFEPDVDDLNETKWSITEKGKQLTKEILDDGGL